MDQAAVSPTPETTLLGLRLGHYISVMEAVQTHISRLPNHVGVYTEAAAKWDALSITLPLPGDQVKRDEFLDFCDGICNAPPSNPFDYAWAGVAASAAMGLIMAQDMLAVDEEQKALALQIAEDSSLADYPPSRSTPRTGDTLVGSVVSRRNSQGEIGRRTVEEYSVNRQGRWFRLKQGQPEKLISGAGMEDILAQGI